MNDEMRLSYTERLNVVLLHEELAERFGLDFDGVATEPGYVRVMLTRPARQADLKAVEGLLRQHDPNGTSAFAQAQAAETELLTDLRRADAQLTLADFNGESPAIQQLALKVLRLEAELAQRRLS
ncbi:MAG: hypothetical protein ACOYL5_14070 [Phototrophicaceae bacterium]|jgi:hypothetical protein